MTEDYWNYLSLAKLLETGRVVVRDGIITAFLYSYTPPLVMDGHTQQSNSYFLKQCGKRMIILLSYYCRSHHRTSVWIIFTCLTRWIPKILVSAQFLKSWHFQWKEKESQWFYQLSLKNLKCVAFYALLLADDHSRFMFVESEKEALKKTAFFRLLLPKEAMCLEMKLQICLLPNYFL